MGISSPLESLDTALCLHVPDNISIHTRTLESKLNKGLAGIVAREPNRTCA